MKMTRKKDTLRSSLLDTGREYCEMSTPHGIHYWVTCTKISDRVYWVVAVMIGVACNAYFCKSVIKDWIDSPSQTTINALGIPISHLGHPAITVCKENGIYDVGEYIRAVFNNFQFACNESISSDSCQGRDSPNSYQDLIRISLPVSTTRLFSVYQGLPNS
jgi:hypothetical protein